MDTLTLTFWSTNLYLNVWLCYVDIFHFSLCCKSFSHLMPRKCLGILLISKTNLDPFANEFCTGQKVSSASKLPFFKNSDFLGPKQVQFWNTIHLHNHQFYLRPCLSCFDVYLKRRSDQTTIAGLDRGSLGPHELLNQISWLRHSWI